MTNGKKRVVIRVGCVISAGGGKGVVHIVLSNLIALVDRELELMVVKR